MEKISYFKYEKVKELKTKYILKSKSDDSDVLPDRFYLAKNQNAIHKVVQGKRKPNLFISSTKGIYLTGIYLDIEKKNLGFADNKKFNKDDLFLIETKDNLNELEFYVLENSLTFQNQYFQMFCNQDDDLMEKLKNVKTN